MNDNWHAAAPHESMPLAAAMAPRAGGLAGTPGGPLPVQTLREMRGLSQMDLAGLAGMLPDHLRAIEAGLEPTLAERQALAAALDLPAESIA